MSRQILASYLSKSFKPICISATVKQWSTLAYTNPMFSVYSNIVQPEHRRYYDSNDLQRMSNISIHGQFSHSETLTKYRLPHSKHRLAHPLSFLSSVIGGESYYKEPSLNVDVYSQDLQPESIVRLDSKGLVPERWMRMFADFAFEAPLSMDHNSVVAEDHVRQFWNRAVGFLPEAQIDGLLRISGHMMNRSLTLHVNKSPPYSLKDWDSIKSHDKLIHPFSRVEIKTFLNELEWFTRDGNNGGASPAAQIFFERCKQYSSFYFPPFNTNGKTSEQEYDSRLMHAAFKCEGGLQLKYMRYLPWYSAFFYMYYHHRPYCEMSGHDRYITTQDQIPFEEIVVLSEALRKQGAQIKLV